MALSGQAPTFFKATTKRGVPWAAVLFTWSIGCLAFLNVSNSGATVFTWFSNISTISGFIAWIVAMVTYLRFRKAMQHHNMMHVLPLRTRLQPYATYFALFMITILTLTNGFQVFVAGRWNLSDFLAAYITLPIFLALYLGHKFYYATRHVIKDHSWNGRFQPIPMLKAWVAACTFATRLEDVDVLTGKKEMDELEMMDRPPVPKNFLEKFWFWLA
jgi:amino acid transporter